MFSFVFIEFYGWVLILIFGKVEESIYCVFGKWEVVRIRRVFDKCSSCFFYCFI